ncbi:MAG: hypothetical protein K6E29_00820 [Cyanobacteria bacterium RUI128]|nr:hypothetical protein [Cyanobacteria bacterium RUI128]
MVSMRVLEKVDYGKLVQFNPTRCSSPLFERASRLSQAAGDVFVSSSEKAETQTNPLLEAVKAAVPFVREPRVKLAENLHDMVLKATSVHSNIMGKDAVVFPIPKHDDLVLRVEKTALEKIKELPKDVELVPITYEKSVTENRHLGIPLYIVSSKSSQISKKNSVSMMEAMAQPDKIMVLRKVEGRHPAAICGEKFVSMIGLNDVKNPDPDALNNFSYVFGYVKDNFGQQATEKCMEMFRAGETFIPENALGEGSSAFEIVRGKEFYAKYRDFADAYISFLKDISEIPQASYDDAVAFISEPKCFNLDFQHTNNTFVDLGRKEFNFVDLAYNKKNKKYIYDNPVKEFRDVLFGKGFKRIDFLSDCMEYLPFLKFPRDFIVCMDDIKGVKQYSKIIHEKINAAAPEEYRSPKIFS